MSDFFHTNYGRHDLGTVELDWDVIALIRVRMVEAYARKLVPGRHRPVRVNARLRRARVRAERGAA